MIIYCVTMWLLFKKMGRQGWEGIIPIYNTYILFYLLYGNGWKMLLFLIPIYNIYLVCKLCIDLAHAFHQSTGFGIGLIFLFPIFLLILALGKSYYGDGNQADKSQQVVDTVSDVGKKVVVHTKEAVTYVKTAFDENTELCPECGTIRNGNVCSQCGHVFTKVDKLNHCPNCGEPYEDDYEFCVNCGYKLSSNLIQENRITSKKIVEENDLEKAFDRDVLKTHNVNFSVFDELDNSKIQNSKAFPFWIYKKDSLKVNGDSYIKYYLFNRLFDNHNLERIIFKDKDTIIEKSIIKDSEDLYSCSIKINSHPVIYKMIIDGKEIEFDYSEKITYEKSKHESLLEGIKLVYDNIDFMPNIKKNYWQCTCGRIHISDDDICICRRTRKEIKEMLDRDYDQVYIDQYLKKEIIYDTSLSFDENIEKYVNEFKEKYPNIDLEKLKNSIDVFEENSKYQELVNK